MVRPILFFSRKSRKEERKRNYSNGLLTSNEAQRTASIEAVLTGGEPTHATAALCDDGSDNSIACSPLSKAVVTGHWEGEEESTGLDKSYLKNGNSASEFTVSSKWPVPETVLNLGEGKLAMGNVSDDWVTSELAAETSRLPSKRK